MPWLIEAVATFCVVQVSVELPPGLIVVGDAESVQTGTTCGGSKVTVMVAAQVTVRPLISVAVPVYVVVRSGETDLEPPETGVTEPTPRSITKDVAFCVVHVSVELPPIWIAVGLAVSVQTRGGWGVTTVTVASHVTVPASPVAVSV